MWSLRLQTNGEAWRIGIGFGARVESVRLDAMEDVDAEGLGGHLSHAAHKHYQTVRNGAPFGATSLARFPWRSSRR